MNAPFFLLTRQDFDQPGRRFGAALVLSLAVHLSLLLGVRIAPAVGPEEVRQGAISVHLTDVSPPSRQDIPAPAAVMAVAERAPALKSVKVTVPSPPVPSVAPAAPPSVPSSLPSVDLPLAEDPTFYPSAKLDVHPVALRNIQPVYPRAAAEAEVRGEVTLLLQIDEYGVVQDVWVEAAKPEGWFEESAVEAVKNVRFRPAERKGRAVKSRVLIRVGYELNDDDSAGPRRASAR